jgi:hypothetical protein
MAYIYLSPSAFRSVAATRIGDSNYESEAHLGHDEWSVVELARNDGLWSLSPDGFYARLVGTLFGITPPRPLANERLEALRRFAVVAWKRGAVGAAQMRELAAAGFSSADARLVLEYVWRRLRLQSRTAGIA